jgi:hypothetical protein
MRASAIPKRALMHRMDSDLLALPRAPHHGNRNLGLHRSRRARYPAPSGDIIHGLDAAQYFKSSKRARKRTAPLPTPADASRRHQHGTGLSEAIANTYREAGKITFDGMQLRTDIGAERSETLVGR